MCAPHRQRETRLPCPRAQLPLIPLAATPLPAHGIFSPLVARRREERHVVIRVRVPLVTLAGDASSPPRRRLRRRRLWRWWRLWRRRLRRWRRRRLCGRLLKLRCGAGVAYGRWPHTVPRAKRHGVSTSALLLSSAAVLVGSLAHLHRPRPRWSPRLRKLSGCNKRGTCTCVFSHSRLSVYCVGGGPDLR